MKKETIPCKDFQQLAYVLKAGKAPAPVREPWKGNWIICYGKQVLEYNLPYPVCVQKIKVYKRFGNLYPNKDKFSIKPYTL